MMRETSGAWLTVVVGMPSVPGMRLPRLTTRQHVDLVRVASALCSRG
ncbi:putative leader peptide [Actinokineospora auranticolor]